MQLFGNEHDKKSSQNLFLINFNKNTDMKLKNCIFKNLTHNITIVYVHDICDSYFFLFCREKWLILKCNKGTFRGMNNKFYNFANNKLFSLLMCVWEKCSRAFNNTIDKAFQNK